MHWIGNRGLTHLIFGGVFERYPGLKFVLTEQRVDFAPMMITHLDSIYDNIVAADQPAHGDELRGGILTPSRTSSGTRTPRSSATTRQTPIRSPSDRASTGTTTATSVEVSLPHSKSPCGTRSGSGT